MVNDYPELNHSDRCDRCTARGLVRLVHLERPVDLVLCGHHFRRHEEALGEFFQVHEDVREAVLSAERESSAAGV